MFVVLAHGKVNMGRVRLLVLVFLLAFILTCKFSVINPKRVRADLLAAPGAVDPVVSLKLLFNCLQLKLSFRKEGILCVSILLNALRATLFDRLMSLILLEHVQRLNLYQTIIAVSIESI